MNRISMVLASVALALACFGLWAGQEVADASRRELRERESSVRHDLERSNRDLRTELESLRSELTAARRERPRAPVGSGSSGLERAATPMSEDTRQVATLGEPAAPGDPSAGAQPLDLPITQEFASLSDKQRRKALSKLKKLAREGDALALELIVDSLAAGDRKTRAEAARVLGDLGDAELLPHLELAASDVDSRVREEVARALEEMDEEQAGPVLVGMLRDPDEKVVGEAIRALSKLEFQDARPHLVAQLDAADLDVATQAGAALRDLGDGNAADAAVHRIMDGFSGGDIQERVRHVKRLRRVGNDRAVAQLRQIMDSDASVSVRDEARQALVKLGE